MQRARAVGLFRYQLIREAADPQHSTRARGRLVRAIAAVEHVDPFGRRVRISRQTVDRWIRDWRAGGFDALVPSPRKTGQRTPAHVLDLAVALKRENTSRDDSRTAIAWPIHATATDPARDRRDVAADERDVRADERQQLAERR
jgi:hypothetical protein